jgi:hypothetical protein
MKVITASMIRVITRATPLEALTPALSHRMGEGETHSAGLYSSLPLPAVQQAARRNTVLPAAVQQVSKRGVVLPLPFPRGEGRGEGMFTNPNP